MPTKLTAGPAEFASVATDVPRMFTKISSVPADFAEQDAEEQDQEAGRPDGDEDRLRVWHDAGDPSMGNSWPMARPVFRPTVQVGAFVQMTRRPAYVLHGTVVPGIANPDPGAQAAVIRP